ncbi:phosphate signaling complex protein PhoU [uncultured Eubacterium sp.]|uniref:phosphate signaling complex protein PhoU n=1 Tax=uncultured Eubacterium sp. TaxID=165185 RepID=UPI0025F8C093|nr:phosphate signaling complex protein PhoU [uncultured Eubacterium sp.]
MRSKFDEQLSQLNDEMINMGEKIEKSISSAVEALSAFNKELARSTMENDREINSCQKKIEEICFNLLIRQQPVARDLRIITAAMKMVTDMERIGDHAADICEITLHMEKERPLGDFKHIRKMAEKTSYMLNESINAYVNRDKEKAKAVILYDDKIDALFEKAKKDVFDLIEGKNPNAEEAIDLLMVAKYFERIGDHATNIAEWVIYSLKTKAK